MKMSAAFPSKWLKAADLGGGSVTVTIDRVVMEDLSGDGTEEKPVVYFQGKSKGLALNKTNSGMIVSAYGDETDDWTGKDIILFSTQVPFQGRMVDAIRVSLPQQPEHDAPPF